MILTVVGNIRLLSMPKNSIRFFWVPETKWKTNMVWISL